jgi:hypothetical protein
MPSVHISFSGFFTYNLYIGASVSKFTVCVCMSTVYIQKYTIGLTASGKEQNG